MAHARLAPSGAKRWMACPGSVEFTKDIPDTDSPAAKEGTDAHFVLEYCLKNKVQPQTLVGKDLSDTDRHIIFTVNQEMAVAVDTVLQTINQRYMTHKQNGGEVFKVHSELKVFPSRLGRFDIEGTADVIIETDAYNEVIDLKYGKGVLVESRDPQLFIYGIGAIDTLGLDEQLALITTVVQPRAEHPEGKVRSTAYEPNDIIVFADAVLKAAKATDDPNAPRIPGEEQCRFCSGKGTCPEVADKALKAAQAVFEDISSTNTSEIQQNVLREPQSLSPEQVRMILENAPLIKSWVSAVEEFAKEQMLAGKTIPGFKLIAGRRSRNWDIKDDKLEELMRSMKRTDRKKITLDDIYTRKMRTPAGMEKALKGLLTKTNWDKIKAHIVVSDGAPQIAPETSDKPPLKIKAEDVFENVESDLPDFLQ